MSTSMSMTSGIVFVFWPPWITFGDTVVWVQAWAMRAWSGGSDGEGVADRRRVRQRRAQVVGQVDRREARRPQVVEPSRCAERGEAAHDLGGGDQRVVRSVGHRAVARRAVDAQPPPREPLLGDVDRDVAHPVVADRRVAAGLGQHVLGADGVPVVVEHVLGPPVPAGLLVGDAEVDQRALRPEALRRQLPERHRHRRRDAQHVDGAAAPHLAVDQLAAERVARPPVGVDGHDVGVAHEAQRRARRDRCPRCGRRSTCVPAGCRSGRRRGRRLRGTSAAGRRCGPPRRSPASRR